MPRTPLSAQGAHTLVLTSALLHCLAHFLEPAHSTSCPHNLDSTPRVLHLDPERFESPQWRGYTCLFLSPLSSEPDKAHGVQ